MTLAALHRLVRNRVDQPLSRSALARIHRASGGNPLFALEIAQELDAGAPPEPGARLPVPQRLHELIANRIRTLPMDAREALLAAAAVSHPTAELVESASSAAGLAAVEETGLVRIDDGRIVFADPLYASAVYEGAASGRAARSTPTTGGARDESVGAGLPDALEAPIGVGQLDRAEALIDTLEERGRELDRAWALATGGRCRGLLQAARGDVAGAVAAVERALVEHERLEMAFERARALLAKGLVERRARRRARAKESFDRALETFERRAKLWAERSRQELGRVGLRRASGTELTAGERRVAELAARGLTNREAADALFISPKTVEANLTRVYRKLGIASRAELGARMARVQR